jgi:hypothetical protein
MRRRSRKDRRVYGYNDDRNTRHAHLSNLFQEAFAQRPQAERRFVATALSAFEKQEPQRFPEWLIVDDRRTSAEALSLLRMAERNTRILLHLGGPYSFSDPIWDAIIGDGSRIISAHS